MEDSLSVKSNESIATSDEFDFVCDKPGCSKTPTLNTANGDLDELKQKLTEVLQEQEPMPTPVQSQKDMDAIKHETTHTVVGQSKFYDCQTVIEQAQDALSVTNSPNIEKQDVMKPEFSSESEEEGMYNILFISNLHCFCVIKNNNNFHLDQLSQILFF